MKKIDKKIKSKEDLTKTLTEILKAVNKATKTKGGSITIQQGKKKLKITNIE